MKQLNHRQSAIDPARNVLEVVSNLKAGLRNSDRKVGRLDKDAIALAIGALETARRIEFFGFGASGILALDAQQKFPLFGVPCLAHTDSHQQFIAAAMMHPGDVAVAISNTGQTVGIIQVAQVARKNGATVIGISGSRSGPIRHCDIGLIVEILENTDMYTPTISRIAGLAPIFHNAALIVGSIFANLWIGSSLR